MLNKLGDIEPDIRESIFDSILPLISYVNGKFYPPWLEKYYEEYSEMTLIEICLMILKTLMIIISHFYI